MFSFENDHLEIDLNGFDVEDGEKITIIVDYSATDGSVFDNTPDSDSGTVAIEVIGNEIIDNTDDVI